MGSGDIRRQTRKWSSKMHDKLTQCCRAFTLALATLSCLISITTRLNVFQRFYRAMHYSAKRGLEIACRLSVRLRDAASRPIDHIALHAMTELDIECIHQATALSILTDRQLSAFSTFVHDETQTPLVPFVVDMFYKQIRNKSTTNRTSGV